MILQWTENRPPCAGCPYDHCIAETPFGRFLITWKSWKEYDSPTVDETPWEYSCDKSGSDLFDPWCAAFDSVDEAKAACQQAMDVRLALCAQPTPLTRTMEVCPDCGNKRCPRATDPALPCTGSNEPGQPGSRYTTPTLGDPES